ncbi:MAG: hypothetical protein ABIH66_13580, partial [bacterium]
MISISVPYMIIAPQTRGYGFSSWLVFAALGVFRFGVVALLCRRFPGGILRDGRFLGRGLRLRGFGRGCLGGLRLRFLLFG